MSEQQLTGTIRSIEPEARRLMWSQIVQQFSSALLALLVLAIVWLAVTELFVMLVKGGWSFSPRFS